MERRGASARPLCAYRVLRAYILEANLEAGIGRERLSWNDRSWIRESRYRGDVKVGAVGRIMLVEEVVDNAVDLHVFRQVVGRVHVDDGVARQPRVEIGFVAEEYLIAGGEEVGTSSPFGGDPIVDSRLE